MRITNQMMTDTYLANYYKSANNTNKYAAQMSANTKLVNMSDDPISSLTAIQAGKDIATKKQYADNVSTAQETLKQVETALGTMDDIYQRLTVLATSASTGLYGTTERNAVATEANELKGELVSLGNTTYSGKYIFGGYNASSAPFTTQADGTVLYNGIDLTTASASDIATISGQESQFEISQGTNMTTSFNGVDLMGTGADNLFNVLSNFISTLGDQAATTSDISAYTDKFNTGLDSILNLTTEVGGRQSRLELVSSRYKDELLNLEDVRSDAEDIDQAEVYTQYQQAETLYESTLKVGSKILQPSLLDYLN